MTASPGNIRPDDAPLSPELRTKLRALYDARSAEGVKRLLKTSHPVLDKAVSGAPLRAKTLVRLERALSEVA